MKNIFALWFGRDGCVGLDTPAEASPEETADDFDFLRRVSVAVQDFDERLREIEQAYQEYVAAGHEHIGR